MRLHRSHTRHPLVGQRVRLASDNRPAPTVGLVLSGMRNDPAKVLVAWGDQTQTEPHHRHRGEGQDGLHPGSAERRGGRLRGLRRDGPERSDR